MQTLSNNQYNHASDLEALELSFNNKSYLEDTAGYCKNLFIILKKITNSQTLAEYIRNKVKNNKITPTSYLYLTDIARVIDTDIVINFNKYKDVLFSSPGKMQEPIRINSVKNMETEFIMLMYKMDINGMLEFLKILSLFQNELIKKG